MKMPQYDTDTVYDLGEVPTELSKCALPMRPAEDDISLSTEGTRFGINPNSRWEFGAIPGDASVK